MAYGGSQARGQIGTTAACLLHSHSNARSDCVCDLHRSSWQGWILNPLSEARDPTHIFMDTGWIHFCCAIKGTPKDGFLLTFLLGKSADNEFSGFAHLEFAYIYFTFIFGRYFTGHRILV